MNPLSRIPTVFVDYLRLSARLSRIRGTRFEVYFNGCNIVCVDYSLLL